MLVMAAMTACAPFAIKAPVFHFKDSTKSPRITMYCTSSSPIGVEDRAGTAGTAASSPFDMLRGRTVRTLAKH